MCAYLARQPGRNYTFRVTKVRTKSIIFHPDYLYTAPATAITRNLHTHTPMIWISKIFFFFLPSVIKTRYARYYYDLWYYRFQLRRRVFNGALLFHDSCAARQWKRSPNAKPAKNIGDLVSAGLVNAVEIDFKTPIDIDEQCRNYGPCSHVIRVQ